MQLILININDISKLKLYNKGKRKGIHMDTSFNMFIETTVPHDELIISRTDLSGIITYVNETFAQISGYKPDELIGKPHSIVRHPDIPKSVYHELWETLKKEKVWSGYVKNLRKDKGYYWVHAQVSGVYKDGKLVEYKSIREPVEHSKKIEMQNKYDSMRKEQEDSCRIVLYTSCEEAKKLH